MPLAFDHVLLLAPDLETGARDLYERPGLAAKPGGRHPGHGTANAIVPLGPDYLEIVTIADPAEAASSPFGRRVLAGIERGERLMALSVRTDDVASVAARLGVAIVPLSRVRPDGVTLRCRLAGLEAATGPDCLPFFIQWEVAPGHHPGRDDATHRAAPLGLAWVEVGGDAGRISEWLGEALPGLRLAGGAPGIRAVGIATSEGEIVLPG